MMAHRSGGGFTMAELLVSLSVALITVAAVPTTARILAAMTATARHGTVAVALAQAKLEELIVQADPTSRGSDAIVLETVTFARRWDGEETKPGTGARLVSVEVEWDDVTHRVRLETIVRTP